MTAMTNDPRPWHQKLRYWVLGFFLLVMALHLLTDGRSTAFLESFTSDCRDINHVTGRCW